MDPRRPRGAVLRRAAACAVLLLSPTLLAAQGHDATAPRARAVRATGQISLDGRLDEAAWAAAPPITAFTQSDPNEGTPASQRTEVRIVYDESAIYVGAMLYDTGEITTRLARRDASTDDADAFTVALDSYHDHQTAYAFATNPSGLKADALISTTGEDNSWDPVWDVETRQTDEGWSAEMRIPFSQLRYTPDEVQVWGIQMERTIHRIQETDVFSFTPKLESGGVQRYGHLEGIEHIRAARRLELLPYLMARAEYLQLPGVDGVDFANPYRSGSDYFGNAGLDLKYRLSSNATLDATFNPDFGQVEVDPAVINLTAFETRFDEHRPFFIEGAEIFRFGEGGPSGSTGRAPELLYSRRIGRAPQGSVPTGALFSDVPTATTILGAGKLTGKVGGGWSVGLLDAVTGREEARFVDAADVRSEVGVEPASNYLIGRVRHDGADGRTRVGAAFTAVDRDLAADALRQRLPSAAYAAGVDLVHEWPRRVWKFYGSFSPSLVLGDRAAILRLQQSSTRYLNRPDATHLHVDPDATRLSGYYAMAEMSKEAGTWTGRLGLGATSPGYEVNDLGFQSYADRLIVDTHLQYNQVRPGRLLRSWNISGGPDNIWNYAGEHLMSNVNVQGNYTWMNYWGSSWRVEYTPAVYNDRFTRGGPLALTPRGFLMRGSVNSDRRKPHSVSASVSRYTDKGGSWSRSAGLNVRLRPRDNWVLSFGPDVSRVHTAAQYVTTVPDPAAIATFGRRYVFAPLDQTTVSMDTRVNVTFSPNLSFEMYAQPFISTGDYGALEELRAPRTFDFLTYGRDVGTLSRDADGRYRVTPGGASTQSFLVRDLDFDYRSLLGNAVLRWEWRPGSTIFLVWQQSRSDTLTGLDLDPTVRRAGDLDLSRDARELFGIQPDNIFLIKVNYWLNP